MTNCYTCGRPVDFSDPASVVTVPLTTAERAAWYRRHFGTDDPHLWDLAVRYFRTDAPYAQTYTICRACIQPVLHARVPSAAALEAQFKR